MPITFTPEKKKVVHFAPESEVIEPAITPPTYTEPTKLELTIPLTIPKETPIPLRRPDENVRSNEARKWVLDTLEQKYPNAFGTLISSKTGLPLEKWEYNKLRFIMEANRDFFSKEAFHDLRMVKRSVYPGLEGIDQFKWFITALPAKVPGLARITLGKEGAKNLRQELHKEAMEFTGLSGALSEVAADAAWTYLTYFKILPKMLGGVKKYISTLKDAPKVAKVIDTIEKTGGIKRLSEHFPRTVAATESAIETFTTTMAVVTPFEAAEAWGEGKTLKEAWPEIRNNALLYSSVTTAFDVASSIDRRNYIKDLRTALFRISDKRYRARYNGFMEQLKEIQRVKPLGAGRSEAEHKIDAALKGLASIQRDEIKAIDKVVAQVEAEMAETSRGFTYKGNELVRESAFKKAETLAEKGYLSKEYIYAPTGKRAKPYEVIKERKPLLPITRTGEIIEAAKEKVGEVQKFVKEVKGFAPPTQKVPLPKLTNISKIPASIKSWKDNVFDKDADFVSDGSTMVPRNILSKAHQAQIDRKKQTKRQISTDKAIEFWQTKTKSEQDRIYLLGQKKTDIGNYSILYNPQKNQTILADAEKVSYLNKLTKFDDIFVTADDKTLIVYKNDIPVALLASITTPIEEIDLSIDQIQDIYSKQAKKLKPPTTIGEKAPVAVPEAKITPISTIIAPKVEIKVPAGMPEKITSTIEISPDVAPKTVKMEITTPKGKEIITLPGMEKEIEDTATKQIRQVLEDEIGLPISETEENLIVTPEAINYWQNVEDKYRKYKDLYEDENKSDTERQEAQNESYIIGQDLFDKLSAKSVEYREKGIEDVSRERPIISVGGEALAAAQTPSISISEETRAIREISDRSVRERIGVSREDGAAKRRRDGGNRDSPAYIYSPAGCIRKESEGAATNYRITESDRIGEGGLKAKYADNLKAIEILKQIEADGRNATPQEQAILVKYVGWGGIPQIFEHYPREEWRREAERLKEILTEDEWESARRSTPNAHYTSFPVIKAIWNGLAKLGFKGGKISEPAMGIGHFFGLIPDEIANNSQLYGIELDSITGKIASQLYQSANIQIQGYQDTKYPDSYFDLTISNVPFGDYPIYDSEMPKLKLNIHDFFFAKALKKTRPGGLVAFITSKGTMDKINPTARRLFAEEADLIAAMRLPKTAFRDTANTEVITDVLVFQKRDPKRLYQGAAFIETTEIERDGHRFGVNEYFFNNPEHILGTTEVGRGPYGEYELIVQPKPNMELGQEIERIIGNAKLTEDINNQKIQQANNRKSPDYSDPSSIKIREGSFIIGKDGNIYQNIAGELSIADLSGEKKQKVKILLTLRDTAIDLIHSQLNPQISESEIDKIRAKLNETYNTFVKRYGSIHNKENRRLILDDPSYPLLLSLEDYNVDTKTAKKMPIFIQRTLFPHKEITHVDNSLDAITASLNEKGRLDLDYMASITGQSPEQIIQELGDKIYLNPETGQWETNTFYLSGNVKRKLNAAIVSVKYDNRFERNIKALEKIQPSDIPATDIDIRLGMQWIPNEIYEDFLNHHLLGQGYYKVRPIKSEGSWVVSGSRGYGYNDAEHNLWGTIRAPATKLFEQALNHQVPKITERKGEEIIVDKEQTALAQEKQQRIKDEFKSWIFDDAVRREILTRLYNDTFNVMVFPEYDGSHLTLPGSSSTIQLRPYQKNAVWRIIVNGNTLLNHVVGAGKTMTTTAAIMEMRRLGIVKKPIIVVPKHLIEHWPKEFLTLYPGAKILATKPDDFIPIKRQTLMNKIATGDWDAIIVTYESFTKVPMNPVIVEEFFKKQITELEMEMLAAREDKAERTIVKELEKSKLRLTDLMNRQLAEYRKDKRPFFDELGIDALFVDESQAFKNLYFRTRMIRVPGIPQNITRRSFDMLLKTDFINKVSGSKGIVFLTGTPIANSITEMFTIQRYLQPQILTERQVNSFDAWASQFGDTETGIEITPEGGGLRIHTRFTKFSNLGELIQMYRSFTDIQTQEMINLQRPKSKEFKIVSPPTEYLNRFIGELVKRAEAIRNGGIDPSEDNFLLITTEGRKAALDMRLIDPKNPDLPDNKVNRCIDEVYRIWQETKKDQLVQLIWCDISTPADKDKWSIYGEIKQKLIKKGIKPNEIIFIHDAKTEEQVESIYEKVRSGKIRVILASTIKMGVGANVQKRLIAMHHLDAPWRPADIEQRDGRIIRWGNDNENVEIYRYITKGSFDAYMWQTLETKAKALNRLTRADSSIAREITNLDGIHLNYAEIKALAAGDPRIMEMVKLDADVATLRLQERAHQQNIWTRQAKLKEIELDEKTSNTQLVLMRDDFEHYKSVKTDKPIFKIIDKDYTEPKEAGQAILNFINKQIIIKPTSVNIGNIYGFDIKLQWLPAMNEWQAQLQRKHSWFTGLSTDARGNITRILNRLEMMGDEIGNTEARLAGYEKQKEQIKKGLEIPFEKKAELNEKTQQLATLRIDLQMDKSKMRAGFVLVPRFVERIVEFFKEVVPPAELKLAHWGLSGQKLLLRAAKGYEQSTIKGSATFNSIHKASQNLTNEERKNFGYAVNYLGWQQIPKAKAEKKRGYKLRKKPTSPNLYKAAKLFLKLTNDLRDTYEALGAKIMRWGVPWPQRLTDEGLQLYAEVVGAVDKYGKPDFARLRRNALIKEMIKDGIAKNEGHAYKLLKYRRDFIRRPIYAYMERAKQILPARYLEFDLNNVATIDFWKQMYFHVELAREFGIEHYRAFSYIKGIRDEFGDRVGDEVQLWWDTLIRKPKPETPLQLFLRRLAYKGGEYQTLKLSPLTSIQNFFQRFLSAMEWGPTAVIKGQYRAWTAKGREEARMAGAIPFDPFESGIMATLREDKNASFAKVWVEMIGMGMTERGNNYASAQIAAYGILRDFNRLKNRPGPVGNLIRAFLSLGGDTKGATERRLRKHGINWKKALHRGFLTLDELQISMLREAESKHFRTNLFTTPTWWQNSPWARQWMKYKIPFAYNMMTKIWTLSARELAKGNMRPAIAFLLVILLTGETYYLARSVLFGEHREDKGLIRRLWEDFTAGGGVGIFGGLMFGRDIIDAIVNTSLGVWGSTAARTTELIRELKEAPEHWDEHTIEWTKREIPVVNYIGKMANRQDSIREFNRRRIAEYERTLIEKEGDLSYYYDDIYKSAIENDPKAMIKSIKDAVRLGATQQSIIQAVESRRPTKLAQKKRPEFLQKLSPEQRAIIIKTEKEHDIAIARVRLLTGQAWNDYLADLIRTVRSPKNPIGERQRAEQKLLTLGISQIQYQDILKKNRR